MPPIVVKKDPAGLVLKLTAVVMSCCHIHFMLYKTLAQESVAYLIPIVKGLANLGKKVNDSKKKKRSVVEEKSKLFTIKNYRQQTHHIQCNRQVFCHMPVKHMLLSIGSFRFQAKLIPKSSGQLVSAHIPEAAKKYTPTQEA